MACRSRNTWSGWTAPGFRRRLHRRGEIRPHPAQRMAPPLRDGRRGCRKYPTRFRGLAGIDPTEGMEGVRQLEYAIKELGFIGAHLYPHWFELAPDHRKYYPFYAKCVELDVPIQMQVGHCLVYSTDRPLTSVGRPILLDTIACDFPELKLIGIHTGWPWVEEMISVAWKHPNVYIGSDAYAPKYWKPEFVHFINSWGQDKVLFGTDFPIIDFERATREVGELGFKERAKKNCCGKTPPGYTAWGPKTASRSKLDI